MKILAIALWLTALGAAAQPLPDNSVYHLDSQWRDQSGASLVLSDLRGEVQLVAFVYSYCEHTCPLIITRIRQVEEALPAEQRDQLRVTLVSLDPERDTPERLEQYMREQKLDQQRWRMLSGDADEVLALSALFGVRYRPMGESDLAHSNMITVLDTDGVIVHQMKGMGEGREGLVEAIGQLLAGN